MKKALALLLALVLAAALCGCQTALPFGGFSGAGKYSVGDFTYDASAVDAIVVSYSSGAVQALRSDAAVLSVAETATEPLPEAARMHWLLDGRTLRVRICAPGYVGAIRGEKRLSLEVPEGIDLTVEVTSGEATLGEHTLADVRLACTSGSVSVGRLRADSLALAATSGDVSAEDISVSGAATAAATSGDITLGAARAASLEVGTTSGGALLDDVEAAAIKIGATSGNITIGAARADSVEVGATSGRIALGLAACAKASLSATSGDISLTLLDGLGAAVTFATGSGSLNGRDAGKAATLTYGDGSCAVAASTTSGSLTVAEQ